jgi:adenylate kinase
MQESNVVVISLHPEHANKILSGIKVLEFRRVWANKPISEVVIYSTAPVQEIVAVAKVEKVHHTSKYKLWELSKSLGGGLSRRALYKYFEGKKKGYAIQFSSIIRFNPPLNANSLFDNFHPPQSLAYLNAINLNRLKEAFMKNKNGKNIFIAGVHGVGKTTMCKANSLKEPIMYQAASSLIKKAKADAIAVNSKNVKDIAGNQELLIAEVSKILMSGNHLLLDGHFVLLKDNKPQPLDTKIFSNLNISAIIAIYEKAELIEERTKIRDSMSLPVDVISAFQELELSRAEDVAKELGLPFFKIKSGNQDSFNNVLSTLIN